MTRKVYLLFIFSLSINIWGQLYFSENFEMYNDFAEFKEINVLRERWSFFHSDNVDFNNNRMIDGWENIKSTIIDTDISGNKRLKFILKRMDDVILEEDVKNKGEIEGYKVDYLDFFTHIARNEIATWDYPGISTYNPGRKYVFEYEVYIPKNFQFEKQNCKDVNKANYDLIGQWHFSQEVMNGNTRPPISLRIQCDKWILSLNPENEQESTVNFVIGEVEKEKWVKWKFNIKFSHKEKGKISLWKDGRLVFSQEKIKTIYRKHSEYGDWATIYFKIGIYKPHWWSRTTNVDMREVYYNNVMISRK